MDRKFKISRALLWAALTFASGLGISAAAAWRQSTQNAAVTQQALAAAADAVAEEIEHTITLYQYGLRGARGAVIAVGEHRLTREIFHRYGESRDIAKEFPGASGFGIIRRVSQADEEDFVRRARLDGAPQFTVIQISPHDGDRYLIEYFEPATSGSNPVGGDIASEKTRRDAADRAMTTGEATLTAPITLFQRQNEGQQAFLLLMPIYRPGMPIDTPESRARAFFAWSYTNLTMKDVFASIRVDTNALHISLADISPGGEEVPFFNVGAAEPGAAMMPEIRTREIFGRVWRIQTEGSAKFVDALNLWHPRTSFFVGAFASLLLSGLVGVASANRQQKRIVAAERDRLAGIVENSSDPIVGEALDGRIISWNTAATRKFGYDEAEALGRPLADLLVPDDRREEDTTLLDRIGKGEIIEPLDTVRLRRDGTEIELSIAMSPILDQAGAVVGVAKVMRDVGARKAEERRAAEFQMNLERQVRERTDDLREANSVLAGVLEAASEVSIIATETDGVIRIFNTGAERMLGYSAAEMVGKQTQAVIHLPEEVAARGRELTQTYGVPIEGFRVFVHVPEINGAESREWTYVRKDGSRLRVSLVATAMRDDRGTIIGYLGIAEDITERRRTLDALNEAKQAAEAANSAKSQFLAMMSHELRTPMTGVLGMADLLLLDDLREEQRAQVNTLRRSARTLLHLLNDILDFAKIEAGKVDLEIRDFSLLTLVDEIRAVIAPLASERGNAVVLDADAGVLPAYRGDAARIRQVLMNLVGNANKFTSRGSIRIRLRQLIRSDGQYEVAISVADTGIGIPPEKLDRLFQPFVQADASTSRRFGGSGLGLVISRRLAELMGGGITVQSQPGLGSVFTFTAALAPGNPGNIERRHQARGKGSDASLPVPARPLRILVAEDNETNRVLFLSILKRMGHAVTAAENGSLAVAAAIANPPDIILMDMQMPVMDGETAMQKIKGLNSPLSKVPMIALTADALRENHQRYLASGALTVVTKPVNWHFLSRQIDGAVGGKAEDGRAPEAAVELPSSSPLLELDMIETIAGLTDLEQLRGLVGSFRKDVEWYAVTLLELAEAGDAVEVRKAAHALKGLAGQFGAIRLSEAALAVESTAFKGEILRNRIGDISGIVAQTLTAIDDWIAAYAAQEIPK